MIVIPAIDLRGGRCVRLFQGDYAKETVYNENPSSQAEDFAKAGASIIHLVDLDGAKAGRPVNLTAVSAICAKVAIPCELGGGIRSFGDADKVFEAGVSRVILGTVACENPKLAADFVKRYGPEKLVVGIDAKDGYVAIKGWIEKSAKLAVDLAVEMAALGVKRFIFTDIATDGALSGPNLESMARFCDLLPGCQVIASGGVSAARDLEALRLLGRANLEGAIVGKALYDGRASFAELDKAAKG